MARALWASALLLLLLLSAQLVASQGSGKCGRPLSYPGKRLDNNYEQQSEFADGQKVAYRCAVGYRQTGGSRVTYCRNGQWEPLHSMMCSRKVCGSAGEITNGRFDHDGNAFGDKAYAKCDKGFVLQGESVRECLDSGWSGTIPSCVEPGSSPPLPGSSLPLSRSPSPDPSNTEVAASACKPPKMKNAVFNETKAVYKPGESLSLSCNVGFQLMGNGSIKCQPAGGWTPGLPKCVVIKCPELKIPHARVLGRRVRFNTTVKITCEDGFQLKGAGRIICAANSSWSPAVPSCGTGQCDQLPHYPNALPRDQYLSLQQHESGADVRYRCTYGYRWAGGSPSIRCVNGSWTPLEMRCEKKICGSAGEIQNGRFRYTGVSFGDSATAECNEGYQLFGTGVRHCRGEGWDGRMPVCEVIQCPKPQEVPGAEMSEPTEESIQYQHVVSYRCLSGTLIGARDIYCTERGTWSAPPPQCRDISCPFPTVRYGSRVFGFRSSYKPGHSVTFTCNPGWKIRDSDSATCGKNGSWIPELPKCVPMAAAQRRSAK
ncbi:C4b-binding protein alpha chain isoform X2 [Salminus brasiliensis]|uniref:C4b-binding protein alpha chain isoform X2 n=1 Tax=Salminus brasiliensis TaxID=930266 RepID=UPI003B836A78